ncbi:Protein N-terminal amidase [Nakaseomyces bracarensis]|uniref:Protein N-terminal amidase n=1 Tax=Nakaseomyces bracarensis TaxID=273131 RepID=A0ABR4NTS2_9SACH
MKVKVNLRVVSFQINSQIGHIEDTVSRVNVLLEKLSELAKQRKPDLVVFPELALTGYNFHDRAHILPYVSRFNEGPSFELAQRISKLYDCYTVIGYPEITGDGKALYNSALVTSPNGSVHFNYRKAFLYETDEQWGCEENPKGFEQFTLDFRGRGHTSENNELIDVSLRTSIGICMDLSPYKFEAPFQEMEFATYNLEKATELMICPMAWLHSRSITSFSSKEDKFGPGDVESLLRAQGLPVYGSQGDYQICSDNDNKTTPISQEITDRTMSDPQYIELDKPDMSNINYWILRFLPFLSLEVRNDWFQSFAKKLLPLRKSFMGVMSEKRWGFENKNAVLVISNRCGVEDSSTIFAGTSGMYKFNGESVDGSNNTDSTNTSVDLLGNLGKAREGFIMRDIDFNVEKNI